MRIKTLLAGALSICFPFAVFAEDGTDDHYIPNLEEILEKSGIEVSGYVDTSYSYLTGSGQFTSGTNDRVFDPDHSSFNFNLADITVAFLPDEGFGAVVDLSFGEDANLFGPADSGLDDEFDVQEAYAKYTYGGLTATAGKYVTLAGAEVIKSPLNLNFSRSILFGYAIPFTHTGLRASYALNDTTTFRVGVNNGWDRLSDDNSQKTVELGASFNPIEPLSIALAGYGGNEAGTNKDGTRYLGDLVAVYNANEQLSFVVNYDYGTQKDALGNNGTAVWQGVAGYANYKFTDQWRLALRGEYFDDQDGFRTGVDQKWKEATLTLAYTPIKHVELRGEVRGDWSNENSFSDTGNGSPDDSQYSVGLEAIYSFGL